MKKSIILAITLLMGISSTTFASENNQTRSMVAAGTTIKYNTNLLERSEVANRLKTSNNSVLKARYSEAVDLNNQAIAAYEFGNKVGAQELANNSIRTIAASIPMLYIPTQVAIADY